MRIFSDRCKLNVSFETLYEDRFLINMHSPTARLAFHQLLQRQKQHWCISKSPLKEGLLGVQELLKVWGAYRGLLSNDQFRGACRCLQLKLQKGMELRIRGPANSLKETLPPARFKANEDMRELLGNEEGRTRTACIGVDQAGDMGMVSLSWEWAQRMLRILWQIGCTSQNRRSVQS